MIKGIMRAWDSKRFEVECYVKRAYGNFLQRVEWLFECIYMLKLVWFIQDVYVQPLAMFQDKVIIKGVNMGIFTGVYVQWLTIPDCVRLIWLRSGWGGIEHPAHAP
jgi:hypothetical protein